MIFARPTVVLSRSVDHERRTRFIESARRVALEAWSFFEAIDGPGMRLSTSQPSTAGRLRRPSPIPLSSGEIGCLLSHLAIFRMAYAIDLEHICIIEDDVEFHTNVSVGWSDFLEAVPPDWLMLHGAQDHEQAPKPVNDLVSQVQWSYGTHFMLLSREAIAILGQMPVTMAQPADWLLKPLFATGRVYCPRLPIINHRNDPGGMP